MFCKFAILRMDLLHIHLLMLKDTGAQAIYEEIKRFLTVRQD